MIPSGGANSMGGTKRARAERKRWSFTTPSSEGLPLCIVGLTAGVSGGRSFRAYEKRAFCADRYIDDDEYDDDDETEDLTSCAWELRDAEEEEEEGEEDELLLGHKGLVCLMVLLMLVAGTLAAAIPLSADNGSQDASDIDSVDDLSPTRPLSLRSENEPHHNLDTQPEGQGSNRPPQFPDTTIFYPPFAEHGLKAPTVQDILGYPSSPAFRANAWMWQDPSLDRYDPKRQQQRFGMAALYYALNGDSWSNNTGWLDHELPECEWFHQEILCDEDGFVVYFNLAHNNLTGTIPLEAQGMMKRLKGLDLGFNAIANALLKPVGEPIEELSLSHNQLDGHLIEHLQGDLSHLITLQLDGNRFHGDIPKDLGLRLPSLQLLNLTDNMLQGSIPTQLTHFPHLTSMGLAHNLLEGSIPSQLGRSTKLTILQLAHNLLEGSLPTQLTKLQYVDVAGNQFLTGTVPVEWDALTWLNVSGTSLHVPDLLCQRQLDRTLELFCDKCCS